MTAFKATLIGVSVLAILAAVQTNALARGGHHEAHARPEIPHDPSDGSGKLHSVLSYGEEGGGKSSAAPAEQPESRLRTPYFGEAPEEGSDLAASRGGDVATENVATGNVATGNAAPSHMRSLQTPAEASDAATARGDIATGNIATGNVATGNVATGNAATAASKYREGGDPAAKGGATIEGQVHEDDVAAAHPESVPQKQKKSKKQVSCVSEPGNCNKQVKAIKAPKS